jgi:hypothetical protein
MAVWLNKDKKKKEKRKKKTEKRNKKTEKRKINVYPCSIE